MGEGHQHHESQGRATLHGILSTILNENALKRVNGRVASERTASAYGEVLRKSFNDLHRLGNKIQNPRNLNDEHIEALCKLWMKEGKKPSTMQESLSKLRVYAGWIGKPNMVRSLWEYLPEVPRENLKVVKGAVNSKSWTENGVNVADKIREADNLDPRFGLMIRMMLAFGLRRKEVVHTKPWKADHGDRLVIFPGEAKGGRPRDILIHNEEQRKVLDFVKSKIGKFERLGWPTRLDGGYASYEYNQGRYERSMAKIGITREQAGVTGHGLRAQYAENAAIIADVLSPTLGGTPGQMERSELDIRREQLSELLGHSRKNITDPYLGGFGRDSKPDSPEKRKVNIESALQHLTPELIDDVAPERIDDCVKILLAMQAINISITFPQAHTLWRIHSTRHATDWVKPDTGIAVAIEAAAMRLTKHLEQCKNQRTLSF